MKLSSSQKTTVAAAVTPILAASRMGRLEVAASVGADGAARVLAGDEQRPEDATGQAGDDHAGQRLLGSGRSRVVAGWCMAAWVTSPVTNRPATTVTPRVMAVDRRVRTFTTSDLTTCLTR